MQLLLQNYSSLEEQVENKEFWHEHINFFNLDSFSYLFKDETVVASRINNNIIQLLLKKT